MSTSRVALTSWPFTATWFPGDNLFLEHLSSPFSCVQLWDWHLSSHTMQLLAATPVFVASRMDNLKASLQVHPEASAASCGTIPMPQGSGHSFQGHKWPRTPCAKNTCSAQLALHHLPRLPCHLLWCSRCSPEYLFLKLLLRRCLLLLNTITARGCWAAKNGPKQGIKVRPFSEEFPSPLGLTKPTFLCSGMQRENHLFS